jgi:RNase H-fold protein (predicted Holliday junction resolvase)
VLRRRNDVGRRKGKKGIDAVAAAFILQAYLDSSSHE